MEMHIEAISNLVSVDFSMLKGFDLSIIAFVILRTVVNKLKYNFFICGKENFLLVRFCLVCTKMNSFYASYPVHLCIWSCGLGIDIH